MTATRSVGKKRLLKLADELDSVSRARFDFAQWVQSKDPDMKYRLISPDVLKKDCGTVGCALGWACTIPSFRRAGLQLRGNAPVFAWNSGINAAEAFFGLTREEALVLFMPDSASGNFLTTGPVVNEAGTKSLTQLSNKATPKRVAKQIRDFVKYFRS